MPWRWWPWCPPTPSSTRPGEPPSALVCYTSPLTEPPTEPPTEPGCRAGCSSRSSAGREQQQQQQPGAAGRLGARITPSLDAPLPSAPLSPLCPSSPCSGKREEADEAHQRLASREGDHLTLLAVYRAYTAVSRKGQGRAHWCRAHFVNPRAMRKAVDIHDQVGGGARRALDQGCLPCEGCGAGDMAWLRCACALDRRRALPASAAGERCAPRHLRSLLTHARPSHDTSLHKRCSSRSTWLRWASRCARVATTRCRSAERWWPASSPMRPSDRWTVSTQSLPGVRRACSHPAAPCLPL